MNEGQNKKSLHMDDLDIFLFCTLIGIPGPARRPAGKAGIERERERAGGNNDGTVRWSEVKTTENLPSNLMITLTLSS